jgi:hypothetical protein
VLYYARCDGANWRDRIFAPVVQYPDENPRGYVTCAQNVRPVAGRPDRACPVPLRQAPVILRVARMRRGLCALWIDSVNAQAMLTLAIAEESR